MSCEKEIVELKSALHHFKTLLDIEREENKELKDQIQEIKKHIDEIVYIYNNSNHSTASKSMHDEAQTALNFIGSIE